MASSAVIKVCTKCDAALPATSEHFGISARHSGGLNSQCRQCRRAKDKRRYAENPETRKAANRRYYQNNAAAILSKNKQWRDTNPDKVRSGKKAWSDANPAKVRAMQNNWREANPDKVQILNQRRRSRKANSPNTFTATDWQLALSHFEDRCAYCGEPPSDSDHYITLHQDHFKPLVKGGAYSPNNIIPACQTCNFSKGDSDAADWLVGHFGNQQRQTILACIEN